MVKIYSVVTLAEHFFWYPITNFAAVISNSIITVVALQLTNCSKNLTKLKKLFIF